MAGKSQLPLAQAEKILGGGFLTHFVPEQRGHSMPDPFNSLPSFSKMLAVLQVHRVLTALAGVSWPGSTKHRHGKIL